MSLTNKLNISVFDGDYEMDNLQEQLSTLKDERKVVEEKIIQEKSLLDELEKLEDFCETKRKSISSILSDISSCNTRFTKDYGDKLKILEEREENFKLQLEEECKIFEKKKTEFFNSYNDTKCHICRNDFREILNLYL